MACVALRAVQQGLGDHRNFFRELGLTRGPVRHLQGRHGRQWYGVRASRCACSTCTSACVSCGTYLSACACMQCGVDASEWARKQCEGNQSCKLSPNHQKELGDPCYGIHKQFVGRSVLAHSTDGVTDLTRLTV